MHGIDQVRHVQTFNHTSRTKKFPKPRKQTNDMNTISSNSHSSICRRFASDANFLRPFGVVSYEHNWNIILICTSIIPVLMALVRVSHSRSNASLCVDWWAKYGLHKSCKYCLIHCHSRKVSKKWSCWHVNRINARPHISDSEIKMISYHQHTFWWKCLRSEKHLAGKMVEDVWMA